MVKHASEVKAGDRVVLPELTVKHVVVVGRSWNPREVWLSDAAGHVYTLDPEAAVLVDAA